MNKVNVPKPPAGSSTYKKLDFYETAVMTILSTSLFLGLFITGCVFLYRKVNPIIPNLLMISCIGLLPIMLYYHWKFGKVIYEKGEEEK